MHQTLHADTVNKSHEDVIWKFMQTTEPLDEGEVDDTIEMNMEESLEDALARAVDGCVRILGLPKPSIEQMGEALAAARAYRPPVAGEQAATKKEKTPRYYALLPEVNLEELLRETFSSPKLDADGSFFDTLMANKRIAGRPHVTLVHEKGLPDDQALWDRLGWTSTSSISLRMREALGRPLPRNFDLSGISFGSEVGGIPCSLPMGWNDEE